MPTLSLFEQHRRAGPSFYQEAYRGESMVPFSGRRTTDGCWLRGDARDPKGTNPMASQGGCCRSGAIHPSDPRHCRLITGLAGLTRRELMDLNPSAARSLGEGLDETLTVHKLRVPDQLRRTLCCTNVIESAFSIVETVCRNVKRWRPGDQIERWVASGLLVAERQFRKVIGHRQIPLLLSSMANAVSKKPIVKGAAVA